uniref:transmembrane protein 117 isoform X2 n=1 Tax=Myxine glutinosa TaxID=7769 RepID=UPI00358F731C
MGSAGDTLQERRRVHVEGTSFRSDRSDDTKERTSQQQNEPKKSESAFLSQLQNFRYYFQHPWSRLSLAYLVIFLNFVMFAEDPVSHSQTEAKVAVIGNCFSFVLNRYPGPLWSLLKVALWLSAIAGGMIVGKMLIHRALFDHGSWMVMLFTSILFLFFFSHVYNLLLTFSDNMSDFMTSDFMGIRNEYFMRAAALGTWTGDFITAWMVTDMMLQDSLYPHWAKAPRDLWKKTYHRIVLFWLVWLTFTSLVIFIICMEVISWDSLNRGLLPSNEVSRAFLASSILVLDLLIVMQDWQFPHFLGDVDINLPGLPTSYIRIRLPRRICRDQYHVHITGKWFTYGIIIIVLMLDLNMWKNQIFYQPYDYGQYIAPDGMIWTVEDPLQLEQFNASTLNWKWRWSHSDPGTNRTYGSSDSIMFSRYVGASLPVKCLAFIPSMLAFVMFGVLISVFGRFNKIEVAQIEALVLSRKQVAGTLSHLVDGQQERWISFGTDIFDATALELENRENILEEGAHVAPEAATNFPGAQPDRPKVTTIVTPGGKSISNYLGS